MASYWPVLGAWLCSHLWEHYLFTGDQTFLRNEAYPLMKGASEFFVDWLVDNGDGYLVTPVSTSPENTFFTKNGQVATVSMGCTMDMSMIRELFSQTVEASGKLNIDADFRKKLQNQISKLLPYQIGAKGQLQEWQHDFDEPEPQHRHLSHLYGLYPGNQITYDQAPDLFRAILKSLELRGDGAGGWSMGWKINLWARLLDGDHANIIIKNLFKPIGFCNSTDRGGGLHYNLWCSGSYQIDGNFGFTSGVAEMLLQSHAGFVELLPALPSEWPTGKITGLKTRGGFIVDMEWDQGKLSKATITSTLGGNCRLRTSDKVKVQNAETTIASGANPNPLFFYTNPGAPEILNIASMTKLPDKTFHTVDFMTEKGKTYKISL